ncbi:MAG TPA: hypothetical protein VHM30_02295 [Gemmatimonadaceae bacterium]|nr:hypothetical protein [Gemmatimonadaceae bacterium]
MRIRIALALGAVLVVPAVAHAQDSTAKRPVRRRQAPIEIRGQVPTPQVVTVRPREVPTYSRQVLVPNFYDHDFWPAILPGYRLVPRRQVTGQVPVDSATMRTDKAMTDSLRTRLSVPADTVRRVTPVTPNTPPAAGSSTPPSGTPPARTPR